MEPGSIRLTIPIDQQPRARGLMATRVLTWLCIPYFTLEEYAGLGTEVSSAGFPIETLLQHEYVRTPRARDEKYQIVRQNGYGKNGECLHISQLWCIVLDNCEIISTLPCVRDVNADRGCLVNSSSYYLRQNVGTFASRRNHLTERRGASSRAKSKAQDNIRLVLQGHNVGVAARLMPFVVRK